MVNKTLDIHLKIITQSGNWFNKTKETSKSTPTHSTVQVKTKCHLSQKLYIDIEQYFLMYPLAIKNIPKINKEFLTDWSNLYDMWSQQSTHACQSTLQASPLNCAHFYPPSTKKKIPWLTCISSNSSKKLTKVLFSDTEMLTSCTFMRSLFLWFL